MSDKSRERFEEYMRCEVWPNRSKAYDMLNRDLSTGVYEYQVATDHWETWHVAWQARDAEVEELTKERDEYKHAATAEADNADEQRANNVRLKAEVKELVEAGLALVTWYDRDGSVGGLCDPIEDMRAILAKHEGGSV